MLIGDTLRLGDISTNPDIGGKRSLENILLSISIIGKNVCLTMPTSRGMMPLICRNKEAEVPSPTGEVVEEICRTIGKSCYGSSAKSQSLLSFSGLTIHCLRDTLNKVFYIGNECPTFDDDITFTMLRPFPLFQEAMKMSVRAALILYVMIYGFKIVMNGEYVNLDKIALFIIKFLFVVYFAVGMGTKTLEDGKQVQHNGMTEFALPILVEMTSNFTEMVFLAGGSQGLCNFDATKYQSGYAFYKVWDAIDCRIGYYLGMQIIYNIGTMIDSVPSSTKAVGNPIDFSNIDNNSKYKVLDLPGSFSIFAVMMAFFLAGNILIVIFGLLFVIVFVSVILYFITAYLVCMVTLYVMAYVSPIFIPMILFERTKGYFNSWLRIVVSCTLQPAVIGGFIALLLTMYDSAIYGNCEFQRHDYSSGEFTFSTFELRLPDAEVEKCEASFGYKLLRHYRGDGWEEKVLIIFSVTHLKDNQNIVSSLIYVMVYVGSSAFLMK
jgi:type IV secretion system protein VirB6